MTELKDLAPVVSAAVAIIAGSIALAAILIQRGIARRRATLDFFIKTDLDSSNFEVDKLEKFQKMEPSCIAIIARIDAGDAYETFENDPQYKVVESYLNIHELLAVGLRHEILDEIVCFEYWADALVGHFKDARRIIETVRNRPGNKSAYIQVEQLAKRWEKLRDSRTQNG